MRRLLALLAPSLAFAIAGCGGSGSGGNPGPTNQSPKFTSPASVNLAENSTLTYQVTAVDPEGSALVYSIAGGADAGRFVLSSSGALTFVDLPDYETPADADGNNVYLVQLAASDGQSSGTLNLQITVTDTQDSVRVRRIGTGFSEVTQIVSLPGDTRMFVTEKGGRIFTVDLTTGAKTLLVQLQNISTDGERGLLGMAPAPSRMAGIFILTYTDMNGDLAINAYATVSIGSIGYSERIATIPHPGSNVNYGGWIGLGPDDRLYVAVGDGGGTGDVQGHAQDTNSRLGKILRYELNPDPYAGASPQFYIPASGNPFAGVGDRAVYAYGFRNPVHGSFHNGALLIGDRGEGRTEEINILRNPADAGANYGWPYREGIETVRSPGAGYTIDPAIIFAHGAGARGARAITGGYAYQGGAIGLAGQYVFGDATNGNIWTVPVDLLIAGKTLTSASIAHRTRDFIPDTGKIDGIVAFGQDAAGNLYFADADGELFVVVS